MTTRILFALLIIACGSAPGRAQFSQYTPPGSLAEPTIPSSERLQEDSEQARWRWGKLRIDPRFWISNSGYRDNVFSASDDSEKQDDLTATVGLGLLSFFHLGPKVLVSAHLLPEYVWWQDLEELRSLNGSYGVEVAGLFNRLNVEAEAHARQQENLLNSEIEIPVTSTSEGASAAFRIDLGSHFDLFASIAKEDLRSEFEDPDAASDLDLSTLDREEGVFTGGVAYDLTPAIEVRAGLQRRETDFDNDVSRRSNSGTSPLFGLTFSGERFQFELAAIDRHLEFGPESTLASTSTAVGRLRAAWILTPTVDLAVYGARNVSYSVFDAEAGYLESRVGAAVETSFAGRFQMRLFIESGELDFTVVAPTPGARTDDFSAWGFGLASTVFRGFALGLGFSRSEVDSVVPDLARTVSSVAVNLDIAGERLFRRPTS